MSSSNCCFLTCIQISQEAGQVVWYSHLFQNFPQCIVIDTVKGFGMINKAEIDVFLELSCFLDDPVNVGNLISGSSAFSKFSLWKFLVHILLKPSLKDFEHCLASMWNECNCAIVWTFFGIALLWDWNENWPFPVLWPLLSFPNLWHIECSTSTASSSSLSWIQIKNSWIFNNSLNLQMEFHLRPWPCLFPPICMPLSVMEMESHKNPCFQPTSEALFLSWAAFTHPFGSFGSYLCSTKH